MAFDTNMFDFDSMKTALGTDPFADATKKYETDDRFYTLPKNEDGAGVAIIAFLPDSEKRPIQQMNKINTTITKNGKKRFVSEWSPSTIGLPCPFHEKWQELWNSGDKEGSRLYARSIRYITNIKVIKDPKKPENEGKVFLYDMSKTMKDKLMNALQPSAEDVALGVQPKEIFNPLRGWVFVLKAVKGANGITNYDSSEFKKFDPNDPNMTIYGSVAADSVQATAQKCVEDIKNHTYKLSDFTKPETFKTYDELKEKLAWVNFENTGSDTNSTVTVAQPKVEVPEINAAQTVSAPAPTAQPAPQVEQPAPAASKATNVDDILDGLL